MTTKKTQSRKDGNKNQGRRQSAPRVTVKTVNEKVSDLGAGVSMLKQGHTEISRQVADVNNRVGNLDERVGNLDLKLDKMGSSLGDSLEQLNQTMTFQNETLGKINLGVGNMSRQLNVIGGKIGRGPWITALVIAAIIFGFGMWQLPKIQSAIENSSGDRASTTRAADPGPPTVPPSGGSWGAFLAANGSLADVPEAERTSAVCIAGIEANESNIAHVPLSQMLNEDVLAAALAKAGPSTVTRITDGKFTEEFSEFSGTLGKVLENTNKTQGLVGTQGNSKLLENIGTMLQALETSASATTRSEAVTKELTALKDELANLTAEVAKLGQP